MNNAERLLLEMKKYAGLASAAELATLDDAMIILGGDEPNSGQLAVPSRPATIDAWLARYGDARYETLAEMTAKT